MSDKDEKSYLGKTIANIAWMIFDKVFLLVLGLLVTVKIANYYGAEIYGMYQYAVNLIAIFEILIRLVDARVVKKQYLSKPAEDVVFSATVCRIFFSILSVVFGLIFLAMYEGGHDFTVIFVVLLLNIVISELRFGMSNRFEYLLMSRKIVLAGNIASSAGACLQLLAIYFKLSIIAISYIALFASMINLWILTLQYRREFGKILRRKVDWKMLKTMIVESIPLAVAASCSTIYARCDAIMLGDLMTNKEVGIYAISVKLIGIVQIAAAPIRESVYPRLIQMYHTDRSGYEKEYIKISSLLTWIYIIGILFSFIILPFAFMFLNDEYAHAFDIYKIHVIGCFFMYNAALRAGHFTLINKGNILMWSQFISVLVNIILNYVGISYWGMYGAAIATAVTQCVSLMLFNVCFKEGRQVLKWQLKAINPVHLFK